MLRVGDFVQIESAFLPAGTCGVIIDVNRHPCHEMWYGYNVYLENKQIFTAFGYQLKPAKEPEQKKTPVRNETSEQYLMRRYFGL